MALDNCFFLFQKVTGKGGLAYDVWAAVMTDYIRKMGNPFSMPDFSGQKRESGWCLRLEGTNEVRHNGRQPFLQGIDGRE